MTTDNTNPWKTLSTRIAYQNPWITIQEDKVILPGGGEGMYGVVNIKDGIFIIALTDDNKVYILETYRYPQKEWRWELPAGGAEAGLTPLECAQKELAEEMGITAGRWEQLGLLKSSCTGVVNDHTYVFLARGLTVQAHKHDDDEAIRAIKKVSLNELFKLIDDGTIADAQSVASLMYFRLWLDKQQKISSD